MAGTLVLVPDALKSVLLMAANSMKSCCFENKTDWLIGQHLTKNMYLLLI